MSSESEHAFRITLLEFTLAVIIFSTLMVLAFERIAGTRVHMERAEVEHTVGALREALALGFSELVIQGRLREALAFTRTNPLEMLDPKPSGYAGVKRAPTPDQLEPGQWYFDAVTHSVVYVPRFPGAIDWGDTAQRVLRWRAYPQWYDADGDGTLDTGIETINGVALERIDAARWR